MAKEEIKQGGKGLAIASLVLGILAIVNSFIPFLNFVSYIFAILAVIFGIIGIVKKAGRGMAIAGLVMGILSFIIATSINNSASDAINEALDNSAEEKTSSETNNNSNSNQPKFSYTIDSQYSDEYGFGYYIEGTVTNNKDKNYSYVQIEFICYDSAGNNLGTALDNSNNLLGKQTWKYKAMFMGTDGGTVDHCDYHEITGW